MKSSSLVPGRFALSGVAAAALCLLMPSAWALGLGRLVVQSSLGEGLRAEIDISSLTPEEASNLKVRIAAPESYRTAGVDYNAVLPSTQVSLQRHTDGRPYLRLSSDRAVQEPFVDVILELTWNTGRLVREYTLLFDPPVVRAQAPAPATPPVMAAAPRAPAVAAQAQAASPAAARAAEARPAPTRAAPPPALAPAPAGVAPAPAEPRKAPAAVAAAASDAYRVKSGDTLSGIAGRTQPQGVSLDQMLVALYRANPQAFVESNMNRLKSGVVLAVPDAEAAKAAPTTEARQFIQAQSADFAAYRQRLAGGVAPVAVEGSARQASGKVEAAVEDRKQASAPAPDKLTLSKAGASAKASAPEAQLSKEREAKDAAARAAELRKNVDDLQKLTAGAKPAAAAASAATSARAAVGVASAAGPAVAAAVVAAAPPASVATSVAAPAASTPPARVAASAAAAATAAPVVNAAAETASAAVPAPKVAAAASRPAAPPTAPVAEAPGVMDSLLDDPRALAGGGLIVALLAGFGVYRYVKRSRRDSGETSFLESRLQPDSFFGVSGGQHIDTRETAAGPASSMGYSLSQLDAIGDVDPVAEADVYLAYGRDLQAEEILKEAMRSTPERLAIRTKLLEVYAKRRDAKGFELLALQLFSLTRGEGEDWAKAQELGEQIDPENPLYRPGGQPELEAGLDDRPAEPLGASTMPQSVLPSPSQFGGLGMATAVLAPAAGAEVDLDLDLDLDLDFGLPPDLASTAPKLPETTQPLVAPLAAGRDDTLEFDLPLEAPTAQFEAHAPAPPSRDLSLDFDLAGISLDLDAPAASAAVPLGDVGSGDGLDLPEVSEDGVDPFERKLELAEEFRQIGDMDGARDLLEEVIAQTGGAIQAKARNMLDNLS